VQTLDPSSCVSRHIVVLHRGARVPFAILLSPERPIRLAHRDFMRADFFPAHNLISGGRAGRMLLVVPASALSTVEPAGRQVGRRTQETLPRPFTTCHQEIGLAAPGGGAHQTTTARRAAQGDFPYAQNAGSAFPVFAHPPLTDRKLLPDSHARCCGCNLTPRASDGREPGARPGNVLDHIVLATVTTWRFHPARHVNRCGLAAELIFPSIPLSKLPVPRRSTGRHSPQ